MKEAALPPFQALCGALAKCEPISWDVWIALPRHQIQILKRVMFEINHTETVIGYIKHTGTKERMEQLESMSYRFPSSVLISQLDHVSKLARTTPLPSKLSMAIVLMNTSLVHNRVDIMTWLFEQPFVAQLSKVANGGFQGELENFGLLRASREGLTEVGAEILRGLHQVFGVDVGALKDKAPDAYALYEKNLLLGHASEGLPTRPKVM